MALHIVNVDNVTDEEDESLRLDEATFATTAVIAGTTYLFVGGYADAGVSAFAVAPDGTLTHVDNVVDDDGTPNLGGTSGVTTAEIAGTTYLFVAGEIGNGVLVLWVAGDGTMTHAAHQRDNAILELDGAFGVTTAVVAGTTFLFVTGADDDGISVFRVASDGTLANVFNLQDDAAMALERPMEAVTAAVGGTTYLFVAAAVDNAVSVFRVSPNGALTHVTNSDPSLDLGLPTFLATADIGGITYLFAAGPTGSVVTVFRVERSGALTAVASIEDSPTFEFRNPHDLATMVIGGTTYLFVAEATGSELSVFSVDANGVPTLVRSLHDTETTEFDTDLGLTTAIVDGTAYVFVTGAVDDGVSVFSAADQNVAALDGVLWRHLDDMVARAGLELGFVTHEYHIREVGDFDRDGDSDILFRHENGEVASIEMNGNVFPGEGTAYYGRVPTTWEIAGTGDFDGDGDADILWRHRDGQVVTWEMEDMAFVVNHNLATVASTWQIAATGDFDHDGDADILWRHRDGQVVTWEMENGAFVVNHNLASVANSWQIAGTGDFDGDGDADILWRHQDGAVVVWEMQGGGLVTNHNLPVVGSSWHIAGAHDFDRDGDADVLWRHDDGAVVTWEMASNAFVVNHNFGVVANAWQIQATGEFALV